MRALLLWACALHTDASDEDEVTLLQLSQRTQMINPGSLAGSLMAVASKHTRADSVTAVESLVDSALQAGTLIDDTTKDVLAEVKTSLTEVSEVAIKDAHDADNAARQQAFDRVASQCDGAYQSARNQDNTIKGATDTTEEEHKTCRAAQASATQTTEEKCDAVDNYLGALTPPSCQVPTRDGMNAYIKSLEDYYKALEQNWPNVQATCTDAQAAEATKTTECNTKQGAFESAFCSYRHDVYTTCKEYRSCFNTMEYELSQVLESTQKSADARKLEWTAIQKIKCYVDVLLSDKETAERQEQMNACKNLVVDTSHLDLDPVGTVEPNTCTDLAEVSEYPCTNKFIKIKYDGISNIQDCQPCPPLPQDYLSIPGHVPPVPPGKGVETLIMGSANPFTQHPGPCAVEPLPTGPWQLAMNINTRDGNNVPYYNWKFWEQTDELGGASDNKDHAFTKDFKDLDVFNNVVVKKIMIVTHLNGWVRMWRTWDVQGMAGQTPDPTGKTLAQHMASSWTCKVTSTTGGRTSYKVGKHSGGSTPQCSDGRDPFSNGGYVAPDYLYINHADGDDTNRFTIAPGGLFNNIGAGIGTAYDHTTAWAGTHWGVDGAAGSPCGWTHRPQADAEGWSSNGAWQQGLLGSDHVCGEEHSCPNPPCTNCPWTGQSGLDMDFAIYVSDA